LTPEQVKALLKQLTGVHQLVARLLYGTGMRLMEAIRLRVRDVNLGYRQITVRSGKGEKDRVTILPDSLINPLQVHLTRVRAIHKQDLEEGYGRVYLPYALERKYKNASREWGWQYVFPAGKRSEDPRSNTVRRHHLDERNFQRAVKEAAARLGYPAKVTSHTFRHSFATHLLESGQDIRTVAAPAHPCARGIRTSLCSTGAARARRRQDHHDLHTRAQTWRPWGAQPAGPDGMKKPCR
jgi:integron integrase